MFHWVETHGFECLAIGFLFSMLTSVMPPLPPKQGWWITWSYNVLKIIGANLGQLASRDPRLSALTKTEIKTDSDGSETVTKTDSVSMNTEIKEK
jgi:hypothetical protein